MTVCVIPARGGSKRIPGKNKKVFFGKPMICWSIEVAKESGIFDEIVVSTDDEEIAQIAIQNGACVPSLRPSHLADDFTDTVAVIKHAIDSMVTLDGSEYICCIYPTAPLLKAEYLSASFEVIKVNDVDYVVPVTDYPYPIQRALRLDKSQSISMIEESAYESRSQDLDKSYHDIGQFYWGKKNAWCAGLPILKSTSLGFKVPRQYAIDIDTPEDWAIAERIFRAATYET